MSKGKPTNDELRSSYRRSDFGELKRGKYYERVKVKSNVVVIDEELTEIFPNSEAVNRALHSLVEVARKTAGPIPRVKRGKAPRK